MKVGLSDFWYRILVAAGLVLLALVIINGRFCGTHSFPEPPEPPQLDTAEQEAVARELESTQRVFQQYLLDDSKLFRIVPPATIESMSKPLAYVSVSDPKTMAPGEELSIAGLKMRLVAEDIPNTSRKQLVLEIKNIRPYAMAYRVNTKPLKSRGLCGQKADLPYNAIAIRSGQTVRRSECIYSEGILLELVSIETVELTELGYFYVTSLEPRRLGLDSRTRGGHQLGDRRGICKLIHSAKVEGKVESGIIKWRDLVDFYARHRCQTYTFSEEFHAFSGLDTESLPYQSSK